MAAYEKARGIHERVVRVRLMQPTLNAYAAVLSSSMQKAIATSAVHARLEGIITGRKPLVINFASSVLAKCQKKRCAAKIATA